FVEGIQEPRLLADALSEFSSVSGISIVLTGSVTIHSSFGSDSVRVYGIDFDDHTKVSDLESQIVRGEAAAFRSTPGGALIGSEMARRVQLAPGDSFVLEAAGQQRRYRVSAIFETGVSDIDRSRLYLHIAEARSLLKKPTGASFIQVNIK